MIDSIFQDFKNEKNLIDYNLILPNLSSILIYSYLSERHRDNPENGTEITPEIALKQPQKRHLKMDFDFKT